MKSIQLFITFVLLILHINSLLAQQPVIPNTDEYCVQLGDPFPFNVKENDEPPNSMIPVIQTTPSECFRLNPDGTLVWMEPIDAERCCGEHVIYYGYEQPDMVLDSIVITVKCLKPDCGFVNLSELEDDPIGAKATIDACEGSLATYFVDYNASNTYVWSYSGETSAQVNVLNPAEIDILWGLPGAGFISVSIYDASGTVLLDIIDICVNILDGPIADFTALNDCVCNNSPISFINNSIGGNNYFWEFGDGNTSDDYSPTHQYNGPGTYQVTLYVTQDNYDPKGDPTCCCTDSTSMTVTVDDLDGPDIFWISTLCEGDTSKYWTDADCSNYIWTATDSEGNTVSVTPTTSPDTICIVWPSGPYGTISLQVMGCSPALCTKPVSVNVPVIQKVGEISGDTIVCSGSTHAYSLPKWPSVEYLWTVTGGTIQSGEGSNSVVITWGGAGVGTIDVVYGSEFLNGLPIHKDDDCYGTAHLDVLIKDAFTVTSGPTIVCVGDQTTHSAFPATGYTWNISPNPGFSLPSGVSNQTITWNTTPGNYTVTVIPSTPNIYCNDSVRFSVQVKDIVQPDSITGPFLICPEEMYAYFPHTSTPGVGFEWSITGGVVSDINANPAKVTWNATGPYEICLSQFALNSPGCHSDTICYTVLPRTIKMPLAISGTGACVNEISTYTQTTAQDVDAVYKWSISPAAAGSVYSPQGLASVDIQWNNLAITAYLTCTVYLCGDSAMITQPIVINAATVPAITQIGYLCPGVPAQLSVPAVYSDYDWSHTATNNNIVSINTPGVYTLTVTDYNNCTAIASFEAFNVAGPVADISTPSLTSYCLPDDIGQIATLVAQTSGNESYIWYCNGVPQVLPSAATSLQHPVTSTAGQFCYWVDVMDNTTLCISRSDTICIDQGPCPPGGCTPFNYSITTSATANPTFCNEVTFSTSGSGYVVQSWNFLDPDNNGYTGTLNNPTHTYSEAGCYLARVNIKTANQFPPPDSCITVDTVSICVPIAADFQWTTDCAKYSFQDISTYLNPDVITSWLWNFGDGNYSTLQHPMHTFAPGMTFNVTLTVANGSGCQATITKTINTYGQPDATFTANPPIVCVGDEVHFTPTGVTTNIIKYEWSFGDGSFNGGSDPFHGYTMDATYLVSLIVEDINGCKDTFQTNVIVHPLPPPDTIMYTPSLTICNGNSATLTAPAGAGYTYLWNTLATSPFISVSSSGTYAVTVTDANGCILIPDSVDVLVLPPLNPVISGSNIVCAGKCVTLSTITGFGFSYVWKDAGGTPIPFETSPTLMVCDPAPFYSSVTVEVTDPNGCTESSPPFALTVSPNPDVSINVVSGTLCEGDTSILMAVSTTPGATFAWSNGISGPTNTVVAEGAYTVIVTDPASGCTNSATIVVNPMPDLCIVPFGCYQTCNPDTICGPDGLAMYQWNFNDVPIPGPTGTQQCLIVDQDGTYTLTGTNSFGCSTTSDPLILDLIICCDPDDTDVTLLPVQTNGDSCCWSLSYFNSIDSFYGLKIHTDDADIDVMPGSISGSLQPLGSGSNFISLTSAVSGDPLPTGNLNDFIDICLKDISVSPAIVIIDWIDIDGNVLCMDTLEIDCPIEPPCAYISQDTIYCQNETVIYDFTVCNPASNTFAIGYIDLLPISPLGIVLTPSSFVLGTPLLQGNCVNLSLTLGGGNFSNEYFCFDLLAHEFDPAVDETAACCSADTTYCIQIPGCLPCDMVYISAVDTVDIDECCFSVEITNNSEGLVFTGVDICALGGSTIRVSNEISSIWNTTSTTPESVSLAVKTTAGGVIPQGVSVLPDICISSSTQAVIEIVIKWMNGTIVECSDTISLFCPGDCGYITDSIICNPEGGWIYEGYVTNTSSVIVDEVTLSFTTPGYGIYNQTITVGGLLPGNTYGPFYININGPPGQNGDQVCMIVGLHTKGHSDQHESCCNFTHCFTLPDCGGNEPNCECDKDFEKQVALGINCSIDPATGVGTFSPVGNFSDCDKIIWDFIDLQVGHMTLGNEVIQQPFTKEGEYTLCMTVIRTTPKGKQCLEKFTKEFDVILGGGQGIVAFPNPASANVFLSFRKVSDGQANIRLFNLNQQMVASWKEEMTTQNISLDVSQVKEGLYIMVIDTGKEVFLKKLFVIK